MPIERVLDEHGNQVVVDVPFPNYTVHALIWRVNVGRVPLYLLDTDNEMNSDTTAASPTPSTAATGKIA